MCWTWIVFLEYILKNGLSAKSIWISEKRAAKNFRAASYSIFAGTPTRLSPDNCRDEFKCVPRWHTVFYCCEKTRLTRATKRVREAGTMSSSRGLASKLLARWSWVDGRETRARNRTPKFAPGPTRPAIWCADYWVVANSAAPAHWQHETLVNHTVWIILYDSYWLIMSRRGNYLIANFVETTTNVIHNRMVSSTKTNVGKTWKPIVAKNITEKKSRTELVCFSTSSS